MNPDEPSRLFKAMVVLAVIAAAGTAAVLSLSTSQPGQSRLDRATANRLLAKLPQQGTLLGKSDAPIRLLEFVDLRCHACRTLTHNTERALLDKYLPSGQLSWQVQPIAIVDGQSAPLALGAYAASEQNKMFQYLLENYHQDLQPAELAKASGVDIQQWQSAAASSKAAGQLANARRWANKMQVVATPTVFISRRGGEWKKIEWDRLSLGELQAALKQAGFNR